MSNNEKIEDSTRDSDSSEDDFQDQSDNVVRNQTRTSKENLPSAGEFASENPCSLSKKSVQVSYQPSTPFSKALYNDQLDDTSSSDVFLSSRELRKRTNCSRSADALISPRQHPTAISASVPEDSDAIGAKTKRQDLSPFAPSRNADFVSPPERCLFPVNRLFSKNLTETNTPSPEKRRVGTDEGSTPIKRLRKAPESVSGKPGTQTESCRSKSSLSTAAAESTFPSSPSTQIQEMNVGIQNRDQSESPTPSKRKMSDSSVESSSANKPCLSNFISPSSAAIKVNKSPTNQRLRESKAPNRNVHGSESVVPDASLQTGSFLTLPSKQESTSSNATTDASSANSNVKTRKRKDIQSASSTLNEGATRPIRSTDKTSRSNRVTASKFQNFAAEAFQPCIEVKKIEDSASSREMQSVPSVAASKKANETQRLESSQPSPKFLNPQLTPSSNLLQRPNFSFTNVSNSNSSRGASINNERIVQNSPDSSNRTSTPHRESRPRYNELPSVRNQRLHRRSVSDEILTSRPKAQDERYQSNMPQGLFPRSHSKESLASGGRRLHRRSVSDETSTRRNLTEDPLQQDRSNSLITSQSEERSRNVPGIAEDASQTRLREFFQRMGRLESRNLLGFTSSALPRRLLPGEVDAFPSNEPSTSRYNPLVTVQQNLDDYLQQKALAKLFLSEIYTFRNRPRIFSGNSLPYIDIVEGQASTSSYQPVITDSARQQLDTTSDSSDSEIEQDVVRRSPEQSTPLYDDKHPEYIFEALSLLQSVLREMMLYNGENDVWRRFQSSFLCISVSCSHLQCMNLYTKLMWYLANKGYELWDQLLFQNHELNAETFVKVTYEKLILVVIRALSFILTTRFTENFCSIMGSHGMFTKLYSTFTQYCPANFVVDIQDEVTRNRVERLTNMINSLLLRILMAFRLLLMYVGENCEEQYLVIFELTISEEDRLYLRRRNRF